MLEQIGRDGSLSQAAPNLNMRTRGGADCPPQCGLDSVAPKGDIRHPTKRGCRNFFGGETCLAAAAGVQSGAFENGLN